MNTQRMGSAKIYASLGFLTIIFWLLSINYTPSIDKILPIDPFFFAKNLSVFYWISIALLFTLLFLRLITPAKRARRFLDVFLICCLVLIIYGTPCFTYKLPVYQDTYIHTSSALKILLRGHTPPPLKMMAASNDPGGYLFFSIFMLLTNLDSLIFMRYYPILISSILLLSLYITSSKLVNSNFAILSPFVYTAFAYTKIFHVYPANVMYVFYALYLFFLGFLMERNEKEFKFIILLLVFSAIITYILAFPLFLLSSLMPFIPLPWKMKDQRNVTLPITIVVMWVLWIISMAPGTLGYIISYFKDALISPIKLEFPTSVASPASVRIIPLLMKQAITMFAILTGLLMAFQFIVNYKETSENKKMRIILWNFIICCFGIFISLALGSAQMRSHIISMRFYSFLLIPYSILIPFYISAKETAHGLNTRKLRRIVTYILLASTIIFLSIAPIVRNDSDSGFYYPSSSLKGADFAVENLKERVIWVRKHLQLIEYSASKKGILLEGYMDKQKNENVSFVSLSRYPFLNNENAFMLYFSEEVINDCDAMIFNDYEDANMIMLGEEKYDKARILYEKYVSQELNKVYSSGTVRVYFHLE